MTIAPVLTRLKSLIADEMDVRVPPGGIADDAPLFEGGLRMDSIAIVELIAIAEEHFGVQFSDEDLVPASFRTVQVLAQVIADKLAARPA